VMSSLFLFIFAGSSPLVLQLYQQHEQKNLPIPIRQYPVVDAIVLLAGDVSIPVPPRVEAQVRGNRVIHTMRLYHAKKAPLIIISGGNVFPQEGFKSESEYTADLLKEFGIPFKAIIIEGQSRNTRENALETAQILRRNDISHILLVTDAFHMPRALATFQTAGIHATASPSSISAELEQPVFLDWIPSLEGMSTLRSIVHEKLGILVYRVRGWIA